MESRPKVLIVDNDSDLIAGLRMRYKDPYEVRSAQDPESAIEIIENLGDAVDVAVIDLSMPHRNGNTEDQEAGLKLIEKVIGTGFQQGLSPDLQIIVLTGTGNEEKKCRCLDAGALAYVDKGETDWWTLLDAKIRNAVWLRQLYRFMHSSDLRHNTKASERLAHELRSFLTDLISAQPAIPQANQEEATKILDS